MSAGFGYRYSPAAAKTLRAAFKASVLTIMVEQCTITHNSADCTHACYESNTVMNTDRGGTHDSLTPRELEVLGLMCFGRSSKEIAAKLRISLKTVTCHRRMILIKTGVRNDVELLRWAIEHGL